MTGADDVFAGDVMVTFLVLGAGLLGLFVFAKFYVIARLLGFARSDRKIEEPIRARSPRQDGPQLAGTKCVTCNRNIVAEREALFCGECQSPVHKDCLGRHTSAAHGPPPGAYR
jgi:hypothetical protein